MGGSLEWIPPCIRPMFQHPKSSWTRLWYCCCKLWSPHYHAPGLLIGSWHLMASGLFPQLHPFLKWEPHPSFCFLFLQPSGKLPPCNFSLLELLPGALVCAFLEHTIVTIALDFRLFNFSFLCLQEITCVLKAGALSEVILISVHKTYFPARHVHTVDTQQWHASRKWYHVLGNARFSEEKHDHGKYSCPTTWLWTRNSWELLWIHLGSSCLTL